MVLPTRLRAAICGATIFSFALQAMGLPLSAHAEPPAQHQELTAALRQLDALERFVAQTAANAPAMPGQRYHFDYPRLQADLARVRTGIRHYLVPSRAQPREIAELAGDYRSESATPRAASLQAQP